MRRIAFIIFLAVSANSFGQTIPKTANSPAELVPPGYVVIEEIKGDLNKDNQSDYVYLIKGTDKTKFVKNEHRGVLDLNRRGMVIAIKDNNQYVLAMENLNCFSSENEDGGIYSPPELGVSIHKGNLLVSYSHGRYGFWKYNFRFQNSDFELIGYDRNSSNGPDVERTISINLMTKKVLERDIYSPEAAKPGLKTKDVWTKFEFSNPIKLKEIADFDEIYIEQLLGLVKK